MVCWVDVDVYVDVDWEGDSELDVYGRVMFYERGKWGICTHHSSFWEKERISAGFFGGGDGACCADCECFGKSGGMR